MCKSKKSLKIKKNQMDKSIKAERRKGKDDIYIPQMN